MAKKKAKKEKGLWAVWNAGDDYIYIFSSKPTASKDTCDYCNKEHEIFDGTYVTELCTDVAKYFPTLVQGGPPVKFQVVAV